MRRRGIYDPWIRTDTLTAHIIVVTGHKGKAGEEHQQRSAEEGHDGNE